MRVTWRLGVAALLLFIVLLLNLLFPMMVRKLPQRAAALTAARQQARQASSLSNVKQLAPAMQAFKGKVGEYNAPAEQAYQQQADTLYALNVAPTAGQITVPGGYPMQAPRTTNAAVDLTVHYKKQDEVYLTTYDAVFKGDYEFANPDEDYPSRIVLTFPFPPNVNTLSNLTMLVEGKEATSTRTTMRGITWAGWFKPGESKTIHVEYEAQGIDDYSYAVDHDRLNRFFRLVANVRGIDRLELPNDCLRLREQKRTADGFALTWFHKGLVTSRDILIDLPDKEPELTLAARLEKYAGRFALLCRTAPIFALLFVVALALSSRLGAPKLSVEAHILLALGFLLFYPLFIFTAGLAGVRTAFWVALVVITALKLLYAWRAAGIGMAWRVLLLTAVFLGLFSYGILHARWTGLLLSIGGIVVVAFFMLSHAIWPPPPPPTVAEPPASTPPPPVPPPVSDPAAGPKGGFCAHCGMRLGEGFGYCPRCARPVHLTTRCSSCGAEVCAECGKEFRHCPVCGAKAGE